MKKLLSVLLLLCASTLVAQAQTRRIVDETGQPVAGVLVRGILSCTATATGPINIVQDAFSDEQGQFDWPRPSPYGSFCMFTGKITWTLHKTGFVFTPGSFFQPCLTNMPPPGFPMFACVGSTAPPPDPITITARSLPAWGSVSAASFKTGSLASESIVAAFGANLAERTEVATETVNTQLADRRISVLDANGQAAMANLLFVSPAQINYVLPERLRDGLAVVNLLDQNNTILRSSFVEIKRAAPGIFTANADGRGAPAAVNVRVKPGNVQSIEPVARYDDSLQRFVAVPLDLGAEDEFIVLALFGTGWRQINSAAEVTVKIGGVDCAVEYAGRQPTLLGLDQINVRLPRTLLGRGEVNVEVSTRGEAANLVQLNIK